jgi:hypothetical protein
MSTTTPTIRFPHETLTPIVGVPTAGAIRTLTSEVYANARSAHSSAGGGVNGHLGIAMPPAEYLLRAGEAFNLPDHPGDQADPPANATGPVIVALNRVYDKSLTTYATYAYVRETIKQQILLAVEHTYIAFLKEPLFGFADTTITQFLEHLRTTYGTMDATQLETNRSQLSLAWNPDQPLEDFWEHITRIRDIATTAGQPINDATTLQLTLEALRKSGVYDHAITTWEERPDADQTWANYKIHFTKLDKLRLQRLTAQAAGFHGANQTTTTTPPDTTTAAITGRVRSDEIPLYYCWSHGLGKNPNHTSASCDNKKTGHQMDATIFDRKNGSPYISCGNSGQPRRQPRE